MNSKKAKALRKQASNNKAVYSEKGEEPTYYTTPEFQTVKASKGVLRQPSTGCSRWCYKQLKSVV